VSLALPPAAPPIRRRTVLTGMGMLVAAGTMLFASMSAFYLAKRNETLRSGVKWVPANVRVPEIPTNIMLITMVFAVIMAQWVVYAVKRNDRQNAYVALGLLFVFGVCVANAQAYTWLQMKMVAFQGAYQTLTYALTGTFVAALIGGEIATVLVGFRTLGGRYSAKDTEGVSALAMYWYFLTAAYTAVWMVVYVTK
jgi:heme/copper-type cytochrome/quinol oxidase subunit 3